MPYVHLPFLESLAENSWDFGIGEVTIAPGHLRAHHKQYYDR